MVKLKQVFQRNKGFDSGKVKYNQEGEFSGEKFKTLNSLYQRHLDSNQQANENTSTEQNTNGINDTTESVDAITTKINNVTSNGENSETKVEEVTNNLSGLPANVIEDVLDGSTLNTNERHRVEERTAVVAANAPGPEHVDSPVTADNPFPNVTVESVNAQNNKKDNLLLNKLQESGFTTRNKLKTGKNVEVGELHRSSGK